MPQPRRLGRWLVSAAAVVVFAAFGAVLWFAYLEGASGAGDEPPLIRAAPGPYRVSPDGGAVVTANANTEIVSILRAEPGSPRAEVILPREEPPGGASAEWLEGAPDLPEPAPPPPQPATPRTAPPLAATAPTLAPGDVLQAEPGEGPVPGEAAAAPPPAESGRPAPVPLRRPARESAIAALEAPPVAVPPPPAPPPRAAVEPEEPVDPPPPSPANPRPPAPAELRPPAPPPQAAPLPERLPPPTRLVPPVAALPAPTSPPPAQVGTIWRLQLAALRSETALTRAWDQLRGRYPQALGQVDATIERVDTSSGAMFRLQAGPYPNRAEAAAACSAIRSSGGECFIVAVAQ